MNKKEAKKLIAQELGKYRNKHYSELVEMIKNDTVVSDSITSPSGIEYGFEIHAFWDDKPNGDIRVSGIIDDGGFWSSIFPVSDDFIKSPRGEFVGEAGQVK